jgi:hypothetical protein
MDGGRAEEVVLQIERDERVGPEQSGDLPTLPRASTRHEKRKNRSGDRRYDDQQKSAVPKTSPAQSTDPGRKPEVDLDALHSRGTGEDALDRARTCSTGHPRYKTPT